MEAKARVGWKMADTTGSYLCPRLERNTTKIPGNRRDMQFINMQSIPVTNKIPEWAG